MKKNFSLVLFMLAVMAMTFVPDIMANDAQSVGGATIPGGTVRIRRAGARHTTTNEVFTVATDAKIRVGKNMNATLGDLRVGDKVHIAYTEEGETRTVHRIVANVLRQKPSVGEKPTGAVKRDKQASGLVAAIDGDTLTLTMRKN